MTAWNSVDESGNPTGGGYTNTGTSVQWQNGPRVNEDGSLQPPNGAFVEDLIEATINRLKFFQGEVAATDEKFYPKFKCRENALAITKLEEALHWLNHRTADRKARGVEGSHSL
jgi:hypothetical protein